MTAQEENRAALEKLQMRITEYREQLKTETDPRKQAALRAKLSALQDAVRDVQMQIDRRGPPSALQSRTVGQKSLPVGRWDQACFEQLGVVWSDLEGRIWQQAETGDSTQLGARTEQLHKWLAEGMRDTTDLQRAYLDAYYNQGLSLTRIAQLYGVNRSTVSRGLRRGMAHMLRWAEAGRLAAACTGADGSFDWRRYLEESPVLTKRQRRLMLQQVQSQQSQAELAACFGLAPSTVSRTMARAWRTLRRHGIEEEAEEEGCGKKNAGP